MFAQEKHSSRTFGAKLWVPNPPVEARSALGLVLDIELIVEHVERRGFISRSGGNPSTDNPFINEAELASGDAARRIRAILSTVWARGWDQADQELAGS